MAEPVIRLRDVKKTYRPRYAAPTVALRGFSLVVAPGEAVALVGPSGCGKSTALAIAGALETADAGSVTVMGQDVRGLGPARAADLRFQHLGFIFQQHYLLPGMTVMENLLARYIGRGRPRGIRQQAEELLERMGLAQRRHALPRELSGGEQQRVCIARALLAGPAVILADEPTGNLDTQNGEVVVDLMLRLVREQGTAMLLVTHNPALAERMDRVLEMRDGQVAG